MKNKVLLFILTFTTALFCQTESAVETLFENKQYEQARKLYENLIKQKPNPKHKVVEGLYNYQLARCCYELKDVECAISNFEIAGPKFSQRDKYLGELYFDEYRFEESNKAYQNYMSTLEPGDSLLVSYQFKAKKSEMAASLLGKVNDIAIVDSMVVDKANFLNYYKFSKELGTLTQSSVKIDAKHVMDKISYTTQRGDRICFSDTLNGKMDIFTSYKLIDKWTKADTISKNINSSSNENYPFFLLDGATLYFASDGENSIGGYDIFLTRYSSETKNYLIPENIGMPFNSPFNDYMLVIDEQRKLGWFATDRYQPEGKVVIFTFVPNDSKILIHTENSDSLRKLAALKYYRKSKKVTVENSENIIDNAVKSNIAFIINDSTVYNYTSQFKSEASLGMWLKYKSNKDKYESMLFELNKLRTDYGSITKAEDRKELTLKIIELEAKTTEMDKVLKKDELEIRNSENEFIRKK